MQNPEIALPTLLQNLPTGWGLEAAPDVDLLPGYRLTRGGVPTGAMLRVLSETGAVGPARARSRATRLEAFLSPNEAVVLVAPYLSPSARDILASHGLSYVDHTGNVLIQIERPLVLIRNSGAKRNPAPTAAGRQQTLSGSAAGAIVRVLLDNTGDLDGNSIAALAGVSPASVSRTLRLLLHEGLLERDSSGYSNLDWDALLRRWAQDYDRPVRATHRMVPLLGVEGFMKRLGSWKGQYALTGRAALHPLARLAPLDEVAIYTREPAAIAEACSLVPADPLAPAGVSVRLMVPSVDYVFTGAGPDRGSMPRRPGTYVATSQLAVDLLTGPGREPEEGEALVQRMLGHEPSWRRVPPS